MLAGENAFAAQAAAMSESLRRTAGLLGNLADHCRYDDGDGTPLGRRVQAQQRQLLAVAVALCKHRLKVAVVGDFDAGKSTLISALAGKQLLPMHPNPATALVTWITHGDQEVYYLCPAEGAAPHTIAGDDFRRFHHGGVDEWDAAMVAHLEAHLPFPLLSPGVVLLDTPGFDNGPDDTARTHAVISDCGGLILCTPAIHPLSERDLSLLKALVSPTTGCESFRADQIFLVLTFADAGQFQDDPALMGKLMAGLRTRLMGLGGLDRAAADDLLEHRTVAVSGRLALRARLMQDRADELASGIKVLEERLDRFFRSLQEARVQGARSCLTSAVECGGMVCQRLRAQNEQRQTQLTARISELQELCQRAEWRLKRLDKLLAASQQDFADGLPGVIAKRLSETDLCAIANPTHVGLAKITNTNLSRWNKNDQERTEEVLQGAVSELSMQAARQLFTGLAESERLAQVTGSLRKAFLDLPAAPWGTTHTEMVPAPKWPAVVDEVIGGIGRSLRIRLMTALMQTPILQECMKTAPAQLEAVISGSRRNATWAVMKQNLGSETFAQSDELRRREIFLGVCKLVGPVMRSVDFDRLVRTVLPGVFEESRLRLREPIHAQFHRWSIELQGAIARLESERQWAQRVLPLLEGLHATLIAQGSQASPRPDQKR